MRDRPDGRRTEGRGVNVRSVTPSRQPATAVDADRESLRPAVERMARDEMIAALTQQLTDSTAADSLIEGYREFCIELDRDPTPREYIKHLESINAREWVDRVESIYRDFINQGQA